MFLTQKESTILSHVRVQHVRVHCISDLWKGEKQLICCPHPGSLPHNSWSQYNLTSDISILSISSLGKQDKDPSVIRCLSPCWKKQTAGYFFYIYIFWISQMALKPFQILFGTNLSTPKLNLWSLPLHDPKVASFLIRGREADCPELIGS